MKLEYKILWFDDQPSRIKVHRTRIERLIKNHGFVPDIDMRDRVSKEEIQQLSDSLANYNPYDLIMFDYDLGRGHPGGGDIAKSLRAKIFTDMVFYSGKRGDQLREILYREQVDGVFIVHRGAFYEEMKMIIDDHIKKISDLNNIRGVVMSATSGIDIRLRESLVSALEELGEKESQQVLADLKRRLQRGLKEQQKKIDSMDCPVTAVSDHFLTHFDLIRVTLKELVEDANLKALLENESNLHLVQRERNNLAHQKEEFTDEGVMILHGREPVEYNFSEFTRVRKALLTANEDVSKFVK